MAGYIMQQFSIALYSIFAGFFIAACVSYEEWKTQQVLILMVGAN
jgi:hypothetical protein